MIHFFMVPFTMSTLVTDILCGNFTAMAAVFGRVMDLLEAFLFLYRFLVRICFHVEIIIWLLSNGWKWHVGKG